MTTHIFIDETTTIYINPRIYPITLLMIWFDLIQTKCYRACMYNINVNEMIPIHGIATRPFSTCPSNLNFKPKFNHTNPLHCQLISICNNQSRILRRFCLRVTVLLLPFSRMFNLPIEVGHHAPKREQQRNPFFGLKLFFVENNRQHFGYR